MQIQRRSDGAQTAYFVYQDDVLLGRADSLQSALKQDLQPVEDLLVWGEILVPCEPTKIICVGLNYQQHAAEMGKALPKEPLLFMKPPSALLAHNGTIVRPPQSNEVHYEGELAVVIGTTSKNLAPEEASTAIAGYAVFNDVTARDIQRNDVQYTRGKGFDTFAALGAAIVTDLRPETLHIRTRVNGEERQSSPVSDMIFGVEAIVSYVSHMMTLEPGDVIATGTPSGVGALHAGDVVEVEIAEIGVLKNDVRDA